MDIPSSVARAKENISRAAAACGRSSDDIILVAATKMNSADRVQQAISSGISVCGENRVQEMLEKNAQGAYKGAALHFIGHLQKNKAKQVVGLAELIHSVD
ncbi:MAG: YggS family pyridoxal phosphate-dependent enzyme, partial [Oscillospiraceae bacterium]|nr:YggS family pyridoxal phosphate-dependent enzyme [Oscillospiraceae bacterium]